MKLKKVLVVGFSCALALCSLVGCSSKSWKDGGGVYPEYPEYRALDYVTLPDNYKTLEVDVDSIVDYFTDDYVRKQAIDYLPSTSVDEVQMGDTAIINFAGTVDGKEFDGGTVDNYSLEIGSGEFVDGFEDQLIGMKVNDTREVNVTFPDDYMAYGSELEYLNGQDAIFEVTVTAVNRPAELTDENVKAGANYETVDEYLTAMKSMLSESVITANKSDIQRVLSDKLLEVCEIKSVPQELIDWYVGSNLASYENAAAKIGSTFEDYMSAQTSDKYITRDDLAGALEDEAEESLRLELILHAIAEDNNLTISDEDLDASLETYKLQYDVTEDELIKKHKVSNLKSDMLKKQALDIVMEDLAVDILSDIQQ